MHSYRICGLSVASDIDLPGLIAGAAECEPQVTIRRGPVPESLSDPKLVGPTWQIADKQFLLDVPNVARFLLNNGDQIVFAPESETSWLVSSLFAIAFVERSAAITVVACTIALFSRETTLIFALTMFLVLPLVERDCSRGVLGSILALASSCSLYLVLRTGFTTGYEHQIDPAHVGAQLTSLNFPTHFFIQLIFAQGMLVLLLIFITIKQPRYAICLLISAVAIAATALATDVTDVGLLLGESLPFYATIFILAYNGAFAVGEKE